MSDSMETENAITILPPRIEEQRLLEIASELPVSSIAAISTGRGKQQSL